MKRAEFSFYKEGNATNESRNARFGLILEDGKLRTCDGTKIPEQMQLDIRNAFSKALQDNSWIITNEPYVHITHKE